VAESPGLVGNAVSLSGIHVSGLGQCCWASAFSSPRRRDGGKSPQSSSRRGPSCTGGSIVSQCRPALSSRQIAQIGALSPAAVPPTQGSRPALGSAQCSLRPVKGWDPGETARELQTDSLQAEGTVAAGSLGGPIPAGEPGKLTALAATTELRYKYGQETAVSQSQNPFSPRRSGK
jgi:hypothetical protein